MCVEDPECDCRYDETFWLAQGATRFDEISSVLFEMLKCNCC